MVTSRRHVWYVCWPRPSLDVCFFPCVHPQRCACRGCPNGFSSTDAHAVVYSRRSLLWISLRGCLGACPLPGNFAPQDAQQDAANLLATIKLQANPENTVGVLTTAGTSSRILITSTQDSGKILTCLRSVSPTGTADVVAAMQKAQLALKHRQNQAQRQRIVLFVGSPIAAEEAVLVSLGKKLKKNAVAVDVINFGESVENEAKLNAFIAAVNADDNSHLLSVASGTAILADAIMLLR